MMEKPTKHYSNKQESIVSEYLGWKRVSASGARPFDKGDIASDAWLCECKTHTATASTKTNSYKVLLSVWRKICMESMSSMRRPLLVIDDGSQKIERQVAVVAMQFYTGDYKLFMHDSVHLRVSLQSFSFSYELVKLMKKEKFCVRMFFNDIDVVLMPIEYFKEMLVDQ